MAPFENTPKVPGLPDPPPGPLPAPAIFVGDPCIGPRPPLNPPGPPTEATAPPPPPWPFKSMKPLMVTSPCARMNTGVFATFLVNLTMMFGPIVTVVKLKTCRPLACIGWPASGSRRGTVTTQGGFGVQLPCALAPCTVVPGGTWLGGLKAPSAPVLPLLML